MQELRELEFGPRGGRVLFGRGRPAPALLIHPGLKSLGTEYPLGSAYE